jgi:Fe-S-cluster-containing dehydrogenase component
MPKYGFVIDCDKCTGCHACFLACKDEFTGNDYLPFSAAQPDSGHTWIRLNEIEHGEGTKVKVDYIPRLCQHCEVLACGSVAPKGAVYRRADGIVIIDPVKAKGCKEMVKACPYGAIYWNQDKDLPQKCTMCAHMLESGEEKTRCSEVCPTEALVFGDLSDPNSTVSKLLKEKGDKVESFKPEFATKPSTKYLNLPKLFIAGEVLLSDKQKECVKGAKVTLTAVDGMKVETMTDFFGDFEFKNLQRNKEYTLKAEFAGYLPTEVKVRTYASLNVGELVLNVL